MGRRLALLIATYEYEDTGLRRLTTPAHDADALAEVLEDPEIAGFEVRTLVNRPTHEVGEAIAEFYADSRRDDLTLLYFTGHGLKDDGGRLHLAMSNTRRDRLRFTALSAQLVDEAMTESMSRQKILILDCCYSGSYETQQFAKSDSAVHTLERLGGRGRTVLTASDSTQYAFEGATIHGAAAQSVFTRHLVEGLRDGSADLDHDGDITVDELYNYVYERVTAEQPNQSPKKFDQVEGRTIIAANVRWELPKHLAEAVASPLPAARSAAIEPLGQLLRANNDLVRRTARRQLEGLLDDDSRAVSAAARATLDAPASPAPPTSAATPAPGPAPTSAPAPAPTPTPSPTPAPKPIAPTQARQVTDSSDDAITVASAVRASYRRRASRLRIPAGPGLIFGLTLLAAAAFVASVVLGFVDGDWSVNAEWYLVAAAVVTVVSVLIQGRARTDAESAISFAAGLAPPGLLGGVLLVGWLTDLMQVSDGRRLSSMPVLAAVATLGQLAWIAAGIVGLVRLRRLGVTSLSVRRIAGRRAWLIIGLGIAAAVAQLVILAYGHYWLSGSFQHSFRNTFQLRSLYQICLGVLAVELAVAGPLIAAMMPSMRIRAAFLGGWVLGGFALWAGVCRVRVGIASPLAAVIALFVIWLILALVAFLEKKRSLAEPEPEPMERRRLLLVVAAALVLPVVLGGAVSAVGPHAPSAPLVIGLVVSPNNDYLYGLDSVNGTLLKIDTTSRKQVGDALEVGKSPTDVLITPDGERLYVANHDSNSISVIDVPHWNVLGSPIPVAPEPVVLALSASKYRLFVLSPKAATITVVDTITMKTVGGPVSAGGGVDLAVDPAGARLFVANGNAGSVAVLDAGTLRPLRTPIAVDAGPLDLSMSSTGFLYAVSPRSYRAINTNVENPRPSSIPLSGRSVDAVVDADGSHLFVLSSDGEGSALKDVVTSVDTKSHEVVGTLTEDSAVNVRIAVSNDGQRLYVCRYFEEGVLIIDALGLKPVGTITFVR